MWQTYAAGHHEIDIGYSQPPELPEYAELILERDVAETKVARVMIPESRAIDFYRWAVGAVELYLAETDTQTSSNARLQCQACYRIGDQEQFGTPVMDPVRSGKRKKVRRVTFRCRHCGAFYRMIIKT